eukprot:s1005_g22.t1
MSNLEVQCALACVPSRTMLLSISSPSKNRSEKIEQLFHFHILTPSHGQLHSPSILRRGHHVCCEHLASLRLKGGGPSWCSACKLFLWVDLVSPPAWVLSNLAPEETMHSQPLRRVDQIVESTGSLQLVVCRHLVIAAAALLKVLRALEPTQIFYHIG